MNGLYPILSDTCSLQRCSRAGSGVQPALQRNQRSLADISGPICVDERLGDESTFEFRAADTPGTLDGMVPLRYELSIVRDALRGRHSFL